MRVPAWKPPLALAALLASCGPFAAKRALRRASEDAPMVRSEPRPSPAEPAPLPGPRVGGWPLVYPPDGGPASASSSPAPLRGFSVASLSRDGSRAALHHPGGVSVWDVPGDRLIARADVPREVVRHAHLSPDGRRIAALDRDGQLRIWSADDGSEQLSLAAGPAGAGRPSGWGAWLRWSSDSATLWLFSPLGAMGRWDAQTGAVLLAEQALQVPADPRGGDEAWVAADGRYAAFWTGGAHVFLDLDTGERLAAPPARHPQHSLAESADRRWIALQSAGAVSVWAPETGQLRRVDAAGYPWSLALDETGELLAVSLDEEIQVWEVAANRLRFSLPIGRNDVERAAFPGGGSLVLVGRRGFQDDRVYCGQYDAQTGELRGETPIGDDQHPDKRILSPSYTTTREGIVDLATCGLTWRRSQPLDAAESLVIDPNGGWVATGHGDGSVRTWDLETGAALWAARRHDGDVSHLLISGDAILSGSRDGALRAPPIGEGDAAWVVPPEPSDLLALALSADGRSAAAVRRYGLVRIFDVPSGRATDEWWHDDDLREDFQVSLAFLGDRLLLFSHSGVRHALDLDAGVEREAADIPPSYPPLPADARSALRRTFWPPTLAVHGDQVALVDPVSREQEIQLFDAALGAVGSIGIPQGAPQHLAFTPRGDGLVVAYSDGAIRLWDLPSRAVRWTTWAWEDGSWHVERADGAVLRGGPASR